MLAACWRRNSARSPQAAWVPVRSGLAQDRPHRARRELDPESNQLALDPPVAPTRVLPRKPNDDLTHLGRRRRATGTADTGYVRRRATSSRCQRRSVAGFTKNDPHGPRGGTRLTQPAAPDQQDSTPDERPDARAPAAGGGAPGSPPPSRAPSETAERPAPADAAATSTETTEQRPENDPPPARTLPLRPRAPPTSTT